MPRFTTCIGLVFAVLFSGGTAHADFASTSRTKAESGEGIVPHRLSGEWSLSSGGDSYSQGTDGGAAAFVYFKTKFEFHYARFLKLRVQPGVILFSSRLQQHFETEDYQSKLRLREAALTLTPFDFFEFSGGAISQNYLDSDMLISRRRAFPGLQERVSATVPIRKGKVHTGLVAEQTVPTSYTLDDEREGSEPWPHFNTEALELSGNYTDQFNFKFIAGHYTWRDLPNNVAFASAQVGNSVVGDVAPGAQFTFGFDGYFGATQACLCNLYKGAGLLFEFQRIHNALADAGLGDAQMWGVGPHLILGDTTFDLLYRRFFIEKDTTVASYMTSFAGNTNRMGDNIEALLDFRKHGFAVRGKWVNAVPMRDNAFQQTLTGFQLSVESHYAPF